MHHINESVDVIVQHAANDNSAARQMSPLLLSGFISSRPLYSIQQRDIFSMRQYFKEKNWLLLPTYATCNTMYLCPVREFEEKVSEHLLRSNSYRLIREYSATNKDDWKYFFTQLTQELDWNLADLLFRRAITVEQYTAMMSTHTRDEIQINRVTFLPDTRTPTVPVRPLLSNASGPSIYIAQYLLQFLQSTYSSVADSTTVNHGLDVVQAMKTFAHKGLLQATTQFVTLKIDDFAMRFTHDEILETLKQFLHDYVFSRSLTTPDLSSEMIVTLVQLLLRTQYFIHDNKLYQQIKGGHPDSALIKLLVNIYFFYWQHDFVQVLNKRNEVFGRCDTEMFFTWNRSNCQLCGFLRKVKTKCSELPIQSTIGRSVDFLDVEINQIHGILRTKVSRQGRTELRTLPYIANYPLCEYTTFIYTQLIHAIQFCTNKQDFHDELLSIYSTCLFNRVPLDFIAQCVRQFFHEFNPSKKDYQYDQKAYEALRQSVMKMSTQTVCSTMSHKRPGDDNCNHQTNIKRIRTSSSN